MVAWSNLWKAFALKLPWWGLFLGFGVAFFTHELLFMAWCKYVVRIPEANIYVEPGYTACLERWTGQVA